MGTFVKALLYCCQWLNLEGWIFVALHDLPFLLTETKNICSSKPNDIILRNAFAPPPPPTGDLWLSVYYTTGICSIDISNVMTTLCGATHILLEVLSIKQWERTSLGCLRIDCEQSLFCPKICEQARPVSILAKLSRKHRVVSALVLAPAPIVARDFAASIHTHISFSLTDCLAKEAPAPKNKGTQVYADNEQ